MTNGTVHSCVCGACDNLPQLPLVLCACGGEGLAAASGVLHSAGSLRLS